MWYTVSCWHNIFTYTKSKATEQMCARVYAHAPYECEHLTAIFYLSFFDIVSAAIRRSGVEAFESNLLLYDMHALAFANDIWCSLNFSKLILNLFFVYVEHKFCVDACVRSNDGEQCFVYACVLTSKVLRPDDDGTAVSPSSLHIHPYTHAHVHVTNNVQMKMSQTINIEWKL